MTPAPNTQTTKEFPKGIVKAAIADGKALIKDGKTKVDATTAMYAKLKNADRETAVAAFMEGAGLTENALVSRGHDQLSVHNGCDRSLLYHYC